MRFDWVNIRNDGITEALLRNFDCGVEQFNLFLINDAGRWQDQGEAVTYVFVNVEELTSGFTRIYGFVSINTLGLMYKDEHLDKYLSCAEIRLFAVSSQLQKRHDPTITYSSQLFKITLQNLYAMSTSVIGFKAIYLNANQFGLKLYKENGFIEISDFIPSSEEEKLDLDGCTPLLMVINDDTLYQMFSEP